MGEDSRLPELLREEVKEVTEFANETMEVLVQSIYTICRGLCLSVVGVAFPLIVY